MCAPSSERSHDLARAGRAADGVDAHLGLDGHGLRGRLRVPHVSSD